MIVKRRTFLAGTALYLAGGAAKALAGVAKSGQDLTSLLDGMVRAEMRLIPEIACFFALDKGEDAGLRSKLTDRSAVGRARHKALIETQLAELRAFPRDGLEDSDQVNLDVAIFTRDIRAQSQRFAFGAHESLLENTPYIINHLDGAYRLSSFKEPAPPIRSREQAAQDLERLAAYEKQIDEETERYRQDAAMGVVLPDFLLARLLQAHGLARKAGSRFVEQCGLAKRAAAAGLGEDYTQRAADIFDRQVSPALARQYAVLEASRSTADKQAGYWKLPDGAQFYNQALRYYTTTGMTAEEVHAFGREEARRLSSRMDGLLRKQGLNQGSVGERMRALAARPDQQFPNTDAGRAELLAFARGRVAAARELMSRAFSQSSTYKFDVVNLPPQAQSGGGGASATAPAADGSRPGSVNFDLSNTLAYPKFALPSLVYHEGYPGHQYELGITLSNKLPLLRTTTIFSGFGEGWGLYAEQLADELGLYKDDPLGELGYLQGQLFRANRCVVDTGIHAMRWEREEAVRYFAEAGGDPIERVEQEIDRYCVSGGQACAYKIGQARLVALRERARKELGTAFDLREFHSYILGAGHLPLELLETRTRIWIEARLNRSVGP